MKNQVTQESWRTRSLKTSFAALKKRFSDIESYLEGVDIPPAIIEEIKISREKMHQLFAQSPYLKLCSNCQEGYCCMNNYGQYLLPGEFIYFVVSRYNFPEPDWEFLERESFWGRSWCLFASQNGCLLKKNRRVICLRYLCRNLYRKLKKENQYSHFIELAKRLKLATFALESEALKKCDARLDEETRLLLQYSLQTKSN